ncbi:MAG TPA: glutathione S-transferase [Rhodospirillaceae bacterium]|nr:glutathione S-transferase [Rhodospirillaceae bacterium]|tara:strand:+ start:919 stop:1542 length:624 start_codon:yes stop_codon:yes gene_type:complete
MMQLYDYVLSGSCYKVRLFLSVIGQDYEKVPVDYYPGGEHKTPTFLQINPLGQIPVLVDDDLILRDAQAILVYLAGRYDANRSWYPEDPRLQGEIAMWLSFASNEIMNSSAARLHDMLFYDFDIDKVRAAAHAAFRVLDDHLTDREIMGKQWIVGNHPTIADIACFPYVALSGDGGISLDDYHAVRRWISRVKQIPGFVVMPGIHHN